MGPLVQTCKVLIGREISSKQSLKNNANTFSITCKIRPKSSDTTKAHEKKKKKEKKEMVSDFVMQSSLVGL